jgi:hypothetical protein
MHRNMTYILAPQLLLQQFCDSSYFVQIWETQHLGLIRRDDECPSSCLLAALLPRAVHVCLGLWFVSAMLADL